MSRSAATIRSAASAPAVESMAAGRLRNADPYARSIVVRGADIPLATGEVSRSPRLMTARAGGSTPHALTGSGQRRRRRACGRSRSMIRADSSFLGTRSERLHVRRDPPRCGGPVRDRARRDLQPGNWLKLRPPTLSRLCCGSQFSLAAGSASIDQRLFRRSSGWSAPHERARPLPPCHPVRSCSRPACTS